MSPALPDRRAKKKFDIIEIAKVIGIIVASVSTGTIVNSTAAPDERQAVVEVKLEGVEKELPRIMQALERLEDGQRAMCSRQDSLIIELRHRDRR